LIGPLFVLGVALLVVIWLLTRRRRLRWRTINVNGLERRYLLFPADEGAGQMPLLLFFHGGLARVEFLAAHSGVVEAGKRYGCMVIFPEAADGWIDARPERGGSTRDIDFVDALLDSLVGSKQIDPARVFAVGLSNGGLFVFRLAHERPRRFTGFATALANMPVAALSTVAGPPVPIAMIFGRQDHIMPWMGGTIVRGEYVGVGGEVVSGDATRRFWLKRNDTHQVPRVQRWLSSGREIEVEDYAPRPGGAPVRFVSIGDWGHRWPIWKRALAGNPDAFDASDLIMEFFSSLSSGTNTGIFPVAEGGHHASARG